MNNLFDRIIKARWYWLWLFLASWGLTLMVIGYTISYLLTRLLGSTLTMILLMAVGIATILTMFLKRRRENEKII